MSTSSAAENPSDEQLARQVADFASASVPAAKAKLETAFLMLYERHSRAVLLFVAARVNPSDADDVAQEIWQKVWRFLPTRFDGLHFRGWLFQIARNYLIDHARRNRGNPVADVDLDSARDERAADACEALDAQERGAALGECLQKLASVQPQAADVVRARLAGESYRELCPRLNIPADRAYTLFNEAKNNLRSCVEQTLSS